MSARPAFRAVLERSEAKGNDRLVLLVIAAHSFQDGSGAYPSIDRIAEQAKVSRNTARRAIRRLQEAGDLIIHERDGRRGTHAYTVVAAQHAVAAESDRIEPTQVGSAPPILVGSPQPTEAGSFGSAFAVASPSVATPAPINGIVPAHTDALRNPTTWARSNPYSRSDPTYEVIEQSVDRGIHDSSMKREAEEQPKPTTKDWLRRLGCDEHPEAASLIAEFGEEEAAWGLGVVSGFADSLAAVRAARVYLREAARSNVRDAFKQAEATAYENAEAAA